MDNGTESVYNFIAVLFLLLTVLAVIFFAFLLLQPPPVPDSTVQIPTARVLPTATETLTPTQTFTIPPSTDTLTPTPTLSLTPSLTFTPSAAPTATITDTRTPTPTDSITATPSITPSVTISPGPSPTNPPTPSPFLFGADQPFTFQANFANSAGCAWQGIGGQVVGLDGQAYPVPLQVHVFSQGQGVDRVVQIGTNSLYGPGGYEIQVAPAINNLTYFVQLESPNGTAISETYQVTFSADCESNVALVNFRQLREP